MGFHGDGKRQNPDPKLNYKLLKTRSNYGRCWVTGIIGSGATSPTCDIRVEKGLKKAATLRKAGRVLQSYLKKLHEQLQAVMRIN